MTCPLDGCLRRVAGRDPGRHLPADDDLVRRVHTLVEQLDLDFDLELDGTADEASLLRGLKILHSSLSRSP